MAQAQRIPGPTGPFALVGELSHLEPFVEKRTTLNPHGPLGSMRVVTIGTAHASLCTNASGMTQVQVRAPDEELALDCPQREELDLNV